MNVSVSVLYRVLWWTRSEGRDDMMDETEQKRVLVVAELH